MTIIRLRPKHSPETLRQIYDKPHDHHRFGRGHHERVLAMVELGREFSPYEVTADLSCGNGYVIDHIVSKRRIKGDFAPGYEYTGLIEHTIKQIGSVDLFILGETLEHLDNPPEVLDAIRNVTRYLILSTPIDNYGDSNLEHYWAWEKEDIDLLLRYAGFEETLAFKSIDSRLYGEPYCYGTWLVN